eukprot:s617_g1.t1
MVSAVAKVSLFWCGGQSEFCRGGQSECLAVARLSCSVSQDYFMALECLETLAPKGALSVSKLVAAFEEAVAQAERKSPSNGEKNHLAMDSFRAIGALDRTGDGRLHFFEFLGAMIAAGRIPIHEADVADVFAAFDIDRDNIISQKDMASIMKQDNEALQALNRASSEKLVFPIDDRATLLEALNRKPEWAAERSSPSVSTAMVQKPAEAAPHPTMQRLLSKAKLHMEWKVQRQVAYEDVRKAVKLKSLNRGYRTPDPSPTRDADADKDNSSGSGLGDVRFGAAWKHGQTFTVHGNLALLRFNLAQICSNVADEVSPKFTHSYQQLLVWSSEVVFIKESHRPMKVEQDLQ